MELKCHLFGVYWPDIDRWKGTPPTMAHRINVNFSPNAYAILEDLANDKGTSMSEVLRDALAMEKYVEDTRREGGRILVERDGSIRELVRV